jgi:DNA-binding response OmpR family regulator
MKKLLLIEDDESTVRLITLALKRKGYEVISALNGLSGLQKANTEHPEAILLDLMLPGISGFEVLKRLKETQGTVNIPVIVVSAKNHPSDRKRAEELGAVAYLAKPYKLQKLHEILKKESTGRTSLPQHHLQRILITGPQSTQVSRITVYTAVELSKMGAKTLAVDLHPRTVEHSLLLDLTYPPGPIQLHDPKVRAKLPGRTVPHQSGLTLLNNLVGSGDQEHLTERDVHYIIPVFAEEDYLFLDIPLDPSDQLRALAPEAHLTLLVTETRPAALNATRVIIDILTNLAIPEHRLGFVLINNASLDKTPADLALPILTTLPQQFGPSHPQLHKLAQKILKRLPPK